MCILEQMLLPETWQDFLQYKIEKQHLGKEEQIFWESYIGEQRYLPILREMEQKDFLPPIPEKKEINKDGVGKKRVVYSYPPDFNAVLKMIAFLLYHYDNVFAPNCYAFRRQFGVRDAILRIRKTPNIGEKYCLKVDIRNYFNSIDVDKLLETLSFLQEENESLYRLFHKLLKADVASVNGKVIEEVRGAMAGTPISPFFANVYLAEVDHYFAQKKVLYFRYSDDILVFADSMEELECLQRELFQKIEERHLSLNEQKLQVSAPGEGWDFLGFSYVEGRVDLSGHTKTKIKKKIKRKAEALRRWQRKKNLTGEHAAKGFIKAMNYKFFAKEKGTEFTWCRWFFPNLTTDKGLKEIDAYMQQYIRYCVTGRHGKENYKISYEQMKAWGYRNLVNEYYKGQKGFSEHRHF